MARKRSTSRSSGAGSRSTKNGGEPKPERVAIADLRPHPRNYRTHPADQLEHIKASLVEHGLYRNVVVARDGTLLAGHGVVEAAKLLGWVEIDVRRVDVEPDSPTAIKILVGDNELGEIAESDDRLLTEHLKLLADAGELAGTGYDEMMLANLVYVTRAAGEIPHMDDAAEWVGMPQFEPGEYGAKAKLIINFASEQDRDKFVELTGIRVLRGGAAWWPPRPTDDLASLAVEG